MEDDSPLVDSFVRLAKSWILLPVLAYLIAVPGLGPGALFVPIVVRNAPLGIISYFQPTKMDALDDPTALIYLIHAVFWALLCTGLFGRFKLPLTVLRMIWVTLVIALFMSVSGCGKITGPGLREPGNWH